MILSKEEQAICKYIGILRHRNKVQHNVREQKVDNTRTGEQISIDGFGAEMAFAKMANLYPNFDIMIGGDDGDLLAMNGKKIDVKSSKHNPTWLTCKKTKEKGDAFYYVMLTGLFPEYEFAGWATEDELLQEEKLKDWGYGEGKEMYSLFPEGLKSLDLFLRESVPILTP